MGWHIEWLIDGRWQKWQCPDSGSWYDGYEDQFDCESALSAVMCWCPYNKATAVRSVSPEDKVTRVSYTKPQDEGIARMSGWVPVATY